MDNVTHTLFALTLSRTRLTRGGRGTTIALVLASNAPDIDICLLVAVAAGLVFGRMSGEARRHNVAIALVLMTVNYGVRGAGHHVALTLAPWLFGPTLRQPCDPRPLPGSLIDSWPRAT